MDLSSAKNPPPLDIQSPKSPPSRSLVASAFLRLAVCKYRPLLASVAAVALFLLFLATPRIFSEPLPPFTPSFQGPLICPASSPIPFNASDSYADSRLLEADDSYFLEPFTRDSYYQALARFFPERSFQLRTFLRPSESTLLGIAGESESVLEENTTLPQISPSIWQTSRLPLEQTTDAVELARANSWISEAGRLQYVTANNTWTDLGSWVYRRLTDPQIRAMWPSSIQRLLDASAHRSIFLADSWRLITLALNGGVYADSDTQLMKPVTRWWTDASYGACNVNYTAPSLIVAVERDNLRDPKWKKRHARPVQIVQWAFGSAPGHPVVVDALRRIDKNVASFLEDHQRQDLETLSSPELLNMTGPGPFTDAVMQYLEVQYGIHWWDLQQLGDPNARSAMQFGDVLVLPRIAFNPSTVTKKPYMHIHQSICLDHSFAGSWRLVPL